LKEVGIYPGMPGRQLFFDDDRYLSIVVVSSCGQAE
jgi:hypothetical protein